MRCYKCFRPDGFCLCQYTKPPVQSGLKFIFLMHPKEAKRQRTGTGRISHLCLPDSEILVALDYTKDNVPGRRLFDLLSDSKYLPLLLYPGNDAWNAANPDFKSAARGKILMPIIVDATWFCSRKILQHNPFLLDLPKMSFAKEYRSIFTFKHEPRPECVSTVETCYYLIKELQEAGLANPAANPEPLMTAFKKMISDQLRAENERVQGLRPSTHGYDWKYTKIKEDPFAAESAQK